ncbi:hypothetical protein ACHAXT_012026 [Thalassiosira profunda]
MPLPPPPAGLMAQIQGRKADSDGAEATKRPGKLGGGGNASLLAALQGRQARTAAGPEAKEKANLTAPAPEAGADAPAIPAGKLFAYRADLAAFQFDLSSKNATGPRLAADAAGRPDVDVVVPLAPCVYRMTDYTYSKKEPILLSRCVNKLGVLRCLLRECGRLNALIANRLEQGGTIEEDELGKARFMELLSTCGVYQEISELIASRCNAASDGIAKGNTVHIPTVPVDGLSDFLDKIETMVPALAAAREEIENTQSVSFHPGLGELFSPGAKLVCHPDGMEGTPLGVSCVQSWYNEETNRATGKVKRRFILVVEFVVSVGTELVFVAASEVYPEFHDAGRSVPVRDLNHRRMDPTNNQEDAALMGRLQERGEFYASVGVENHYLEYHANAFFPIIGGWGNNAARPLSKGGRVMVDVRRSYLEGHVPIRATSDGMSDTVKEAMKLFDQSKRTGVAVPFRTALLPEFGRVIKKSVDGSERKDSDRNGLWMAWPMLTGFSFTARCWGKLLLGLPKAASNVEGGSAKASKENSPTRPHVTRMGVEVAALGGAGRCGNVNYINFQEKAFEQLVLADEKKELIRAVARNAGGGSKFDSSGDLFDDDDEDEDNEGLDVVANKGAASIFLLSGPPGCGKTLTAEAIAELLKKPLYVVTAGDLGITAAEVEKSFGSVLDLCSTWDALVLVDEADIFLEERSSTEIQRNALVCVMLRLLEYYHGCLFLSRTETQRQLMRPLPVG